MLYMTSRHALYDVMTCVCESHMKDARCRVRGGQAHVLVEPRVGIARGLLTCIASALLTSSCLDAGYFADVHLSTPCVSAGSMRDVHE